MTLSLSVGTNTYVTLAEADAFFEGHVEAATWEEADVPAKSAALVTATRAIDRMFLVGRKADIEEQTMAFPRCYPPSMVRTWVLVDTSPLENQFMIPITSGAYVCDAAVPQAVKDAECEEALARLDTTRLQRRKLQQDGVVSFSLGPLSESYSSGSSGTNTRVRALLSIEAQELMARYRAGAVRIR